MLFPPSQYRIPQAPADSMTLYLCLPLLVALLHSAQCLYNCSSLYERTPGRKRYCTQMFKCSNVPNSEKTITVVNITSLNFLQKTRTWLSTVAPVWSLWRSTCARPSGQVSTPPTWLWTGTTTPRSAWALSTPVWTLPSSVTSSLLTTVRITPVVSLCRSESIYVFKRSVKSYVASRGRHCNGCGFCYLVQIVDETPDPAGPFSGFSSIQSVIITGYIDTPRSDQGLISYSTDLYYHFSCRYPLEYLINNTQIVAWVARQLFFFFFLKNNYLKKKKKGNWNYFF